MVITASSLLHQSVEVPASHAAESDPKDVVDHRESNGGEILSQ